MTAEELLERLKDIVEIERHPKLVVATMTEHVDNFVDAAGYSVIAGSL